jgi:23S rRNA pseudouridine1911/1915/1917 synthase
MAVVAGGRTARTHYRIKERFTGYTLLDMELETGRTHQIRVHLAYAGYPVAGDPVYGPRRNPLHLPGQALHAYRIVFTHPRTDEPLTFEAPLPPVFKDVLDLLRRSSQKGF